jgi:hypothetical protein
MAVGSNGLVRRVRGWWAWTHLNLPSRNIFFIDTLPLRGDDDDMDCRKCGHRWTPIKAKPLKCPGCNQPKYWLAKVRNVMPIAKSGQK